jgi:integrase
MQRHASKNRTAGETQRIFDTYVLPYWREHQISEISRRDVADLLDRIEDGKVKGPDGRRYGGPVQADRTLAAVRKLFNWYATRDDDFISPVVPGMARTKPRELARDRVLSDEEIKVMWPLLDGLGTFGAIVKMLLLTAQRRDEVARMGHSEIDSHGVWIIPAERYKTGRPNVVPLPQAALAVIEDQPAYNECDFVLTTTGQNPYSGFSKAKARLDGMMLDSMREAAEKSGEDPGNVELSDWRLHDLRRTAKTLMMRAGVRPDVSERVLGHVISGVEGVYDRHGYLEEKKEALEKLAVVIDQILGSAPPAIIANQGGIR